MDTIIFKKIYNYGLDLLFPSRCIICNKYGSLLCFECSSEIELSKTSLCPGCGKITKKCQYCQNCKQRMKTSLSSVYVSTSYNSPVVKKMIADFKYIGITGLSSICGELIYQRVKEACPSAGGLNDSFVVVPVPLNHFKLNRRGFNQAELLARYLSKRLGIPGGQALKRVKNTQNQVGLLREARLLNLSGAFECVDQELIFGKNIILVDDVLTTGATLSECAKILRAAGAKKIIGAVVARNI